MKTIARSPHIVDGSRSVYAKGRVPIAGLIYFFLLPLVPVLIVLVDSRPGFRLIMLSFAVSGVMMGVLLLAWVRAMRERLVRIAKTGPLRFMAQTRVRMALWLFPVVTLLPAVTIGAVQALGLPTMNGVRLERAPYALGLVSLGLLVWALVTLRHPLGLLVDESGLRGVRGSTSVDIPWEDVGEVEPIGPHGPKLGIEALGRAPVVINAHHLGSDPAAVAVVIAYFRDNPDQRHVLRDGITAMRTVVDALHP